MAVYHFARRGIKDQLVFALTQYRIRLVGTHELRELPNSVR